MNPLLEAAKTIGDESEEKPQAATQKNETFDPENPPEVDNGNASLQRFMGSFGSPQRWAGR